MSNQTSTKYKPIKANRIRNDYGQYGDRSWLMRQMRRKWRHSTKAQDRTSWVGNDFDNGLKMRILTVVGCMIYTLKTIAYILNIKI
jgi:hypothetical protein